METVELDGLRILSLLLSPPTLSPPTLSPPRLTLPSGGGPT